MSQIKNSCYIIIHYIMLHIKMKSLILFRHIIKTSQYSTLYRYDKWYFSYFISEEAFMVKIMTNIMGQ